MRIIGAIALGLALGACGGEADCDRAWCEQSCAKVAVCEQSDTRAFVAQCSADCLEMLDVRAIAGEPLDTCNGPRYTCEELAQLRQ